MRRALLFTGAGLMVAAAGLPSFAAPKQTARTVTNGFVRSNVLLPIGGKQQVSNPVPQDLSREVSLWKSPCTSALQTFMAPCRRWSVGSLAIIP